MPALLKPCPPIVFVRLTRRPRSSSLCVSIINSVLRPILNMPVLDVCCHTDDTLSARTDSTSYSTIQLCYLQENSSPDLSLPLRRTTLPALSMPSPAISLPSALSLLLRLPLLLLLSAA